MNPLIHAEMARTHADELHRAARRASAAAGTPRTGSRAPARNARRLVLSLRRPMPQSG
jgi:hypothetical protein